VGFERHPPASKTWEPKHRVGGGGKPRSREAVRLFAQGFTRDDRPGEVECGGDGRKHSGRFVILGQAVQDASYHPLCRNNQAISYSQALCGAGSGLRRTTSLLQCSICSAVAGTAEMPASWRVRVRAYGNYDCGACGLDEMCITDFDRGEASWARG
jgi:hypothetical protein